MKENADYVCGIIAHNLKTFREKQKFSMDQLAALSGVSKSMIGQMSAPRPIPLFLPSGRSLPDCTYRLQP